jgi:hypothetical protein
MTLGLKRASQPWIVVHGRLMFAMIGAPEGEQLSEPSGHETRDSGRTD